MQPPGWLRSAGPDRNARPRFQHVAGFEVARSSSGAWQMPIDTGNHGARINSCSISRVDMMLFEMPRPDFHVDRGGPSGEKNGQAEHMVVVEMGEEQCARPWRRTARPTSRPGVCRCRRRRSSHGRAATHLDAGGVAAVAAGIRDRQLMLPRVPHNTNPEGAVGFGRLAELGVRLPAQDLGDVGDRLGLQRLAVEGPSRLATRLYRRESDLPAKIGGLVSMSGRGPMLARQEFACLAFAACCRQLSRGMAERGRRSTLTISTVISGNSVSSRRKWSLRMRSASSGIDARTVAVRDTSQRMAISPTISLGSTSATLIWPVADRP